MENNRRSIVTILGKSGSGKSELIRRILRDVDRPTFIIDALSEYRDFGVHFYSSESLFRFVIDGRPNMTRIYVLNTQHDDESERFFRFVRWLKNVSVVVDECDMYAGTHNIDPNLSEIVRYGRHRNISLLCAARRPSEINITIRSQSDSIVSFKQDETSDVKRLAERWGSEAERVRDLGEYQFIVFGDLTYFVQSDILIYNNFNKTEKNDELARLR